MEKVEGKSIHFPKVLFSEFTDEKKITGATIFIFEEPVLCAIDKRGGAQTTRQVDALQPPHISLGIDAILLSGGSAFGLGCANGLVEFLREIGRGFGIGNVKVPRVPTACIFDLTIGESSPPTPEDIYKACKRARKEISEDDSGSKGAGTGATVGKLFGIPKATKSGIGIAWSERVNSLDEKEGKVKNLVVAVVNAFGNIVENGKIIAGVRTDDGFFDFIDEGVFHPPKYPEDYFSSTVLLVGITEGTFTLPELSILAQCMNSALSSCVKPAHTPFDGDVAFAVSTGTKKANIFDVFGELYRLTRISVIRAVKSAKGMGGVPSLYEHMEQVRKMGKSKEQKE